MFKVTNGASGELHGMFLSGGSKPKWEEEGKGFLRKQDALAAAKKAAKKGLEGDFVLVDFAFAAIGHTTHEIDL
jgi:hypothetical protein